MPSQEINEMTQREWRELGFYYDRDDDARHWILLGSKAGLLRFADALRTYAGNPQRTQISEHEHFGPYAYLEVGTWISPEITEHWIAGPLDDIHGLSETIRMHLNTAAVGDQISLRATFAPLSPFELVLVIQPDAFDPAKADAACWQVA